MKAYDFHHLNHVKENRASKRTLWITLFLTLFFALVELIGGLISHSLALLSDSAHMITDVLALSLSLTASYMASKNPNPRYTFGFLRFETIAAFINGLTLVIIAIGVLFESIRRLINPQEIDFKLMFTIAFIGLIVNAILTWILSVNARKQQNLNIQSALWHFFGDLLSSIGIIISSILIYWTGFFIFDPIISMIISGIIFFGGSKILRESYLILMESVPEQFDLEQIRQDMYQIEEVLDVHELHLWAISTDHYSLTAHVFIHANAQPLHVVEKINRLLKEKYHIKHTTIQTEHPTIHDHGEYGKKFLAESKPESLPQKEDMSINKP